MVKSITSERVKFLSLIARQELEIEIPKVVPIKMVLGESLYEDDQTTRGISLEYHEFKFSYDEHVEIFNELMRHRRAIRCFDVAQRSSTTLTHERREESIILWVFLNLRVVKGMSSWRHRISALRI